MNPLKEFLGTDDLEDVSREFQELKAVLDPIFGKPATTSNETAEPQDKPVSKDIEEFRRLNGGR